jgi:hypothetical protein
LPGFLIVLRTFPALLRGKEMWIMLDYVVTSITGWLLIAMLAVTIAYPFVLRGGVLGPVQPFMKRMRFHYWFGYGITGIVLVHAWISMSAGLAKYVNAMGLDLATGALFLLIIQVTVGWLLSQPQLKRRSFLRQGHLWVMISLVLLVMAHLLLNSSTLQILVVR